MIGTSGSTVLDFAPLIQAAMQAVFLAVLSILAYWLQGHVKDENTRNAILSAAENGVNHAINRIDAASKDGSMSVPVASGVTAMAAKYVLDMVPGAVKSMGMDEKNIVNLVISKLPANVTGNITDANIDFIASRISGKPGTAPPATDLSQLTAALTPIIQQAASDAITAHYAGAAAKPVAAAPGTKPTPVSTSAAVAEFQDPTVVNNPPLAP
jgi:hypothetical protein